MTKINVEDIAKKNGSIGEIVTPEMLHKGLEAVKSIGGEALFNFNWLHCVCALDDTNGNHDYYVALPYVSLFYVGNDITDLSNALLAYNEQVVEEVASMISEDLGCLYNE